MLRDRAVKESRRARHSRAGIANIGIVATLMTNAAFGAVARHEDGVIAQGPQPLADRVQQLLMVAARDCLLYTSPSPRDS